MIIYMLNISDNNSQKEYGISAYSNGILEKAVYSITSNKQDVVQLISICNELKVDICHLDDIIEDYLTDFCIQAFSIIKYML